ncbi:hypothetical protein LP420_24500 [Massilia sp. B-10]|nr:hypothetical protein LP420_24500 [Massilia sp. B-10]UUZ52489.1 hypothetical protein LP419_23955 [Massilia sp. H-1]
MRSQAKPAAALRQRFPLQSGRIDAAIAASGRPLASLAYLPMSSRMQFWTVLLDSRTMDVVGFIELDSF